MDDVTCPHCGGSGEDYPGHTCEVCDGSGKIPASEAEA